jgi:hypothetical protein
MPVILVVLGTFALCFAVDKGFTKIFRGKKEHQSGLSVKLNKKYGLVGILLTVLGVAALIAGIREGSGLLMVGGPIVSLMGVGLLVYYMSFGIFYDEDSFIVTTFGKKNVTYYYRDIRKQQLYNVTGGALIIELHMKDGRTVSLQSGMDGVYPFLDAAFSGWCRQQGIRKESCAFHDPQNSCWFPPVED